MSTRNEGILNFVLIGAKASGKTIYLGTLFGEKTIQSSDGETTSYVSSIWKTINEVDPLTKERQCKVPANNAMLKELHFWYQHDKFGRVAFSIDDYDGSFTESVSKWETSNKAESLEANTYKTTSKEREQLLLNVKNSEGCFFFLPYEESTERFKDFAEEIDAFIKWAQFSSSAKSPIPASIVVTKWDDSPYFQSDDEEKAIEEYINSNVHFRRTYETIKKNFKHTQLIAISSCKNYNLSKPLDFSLERTFETWYQRAEQYYKDKEYENLVRYLTERYNDVKFNKSYYFVSLYEEGQKKYYEIVEKEFAQINTLSEKEEYFTEIEPLFITEKSLLNPLRKELKNLKRSAALLKIRNYTLAIVVVAGTAIGIIEYKNKLDAEEAYKKIHSQYIKEVPYKEMQKEIDQFLDQYKKVNFLYAFANIPQKRNDIQKIKSELYAKTRQRIDEQIKGILTNSKYTDSEKLMHLSALKNQAVGEVQKEKIEQKINQFRIKSTLKKWEDRAKHCLATCVEDSGIAQINALLEEYDSNNSLVHTKKSDKLVQKLLQKKELLGAYQLISKTSNLDELLEILAKEKEIDEKFFNSEVFRTFLINKIIAYDADKYNSDKGEELLRKFKSKHTKKSIFEFLNGDIKKFINLKNNADDILTKLESIKNVSDLQSIDFNKYIDFEDSDKKKIQNKIQNKIDYFVKEVYDEKPVNSLNAEELNMWKNKMKQFDDISLYANNITFFSYFLNDEIKNTIQKMKERVDNIAKIDEIGVDGIQVSVKGEEDNTLGFGCGTMDEDDITIIGFSANLTDSDENCSDNNVATFSQKITLKPKTYTITIEDDDVFTNSVRDNNVSFSREELLDLLNGGVVDEPMDDGKMILYFKKKS